MDLKASALTETEAGSRIGVVPDRVKGADSLIEPEANDEQFGLNRFARRSHREESYAHDKELPDYDEDSSIYDKELPNYDEEYPNYDEEVPDYESQSRFDDEYTFRKNDDNVARKIKSAVGVSPVILVTIILVALCVIICCAVIACGIKNCSCDGIW